jgi:hypothetical protein
MCLCLLCLFLTCIVGELLIGVAFHAKERRPPYYDMVDHPYVYYRHAPEPGETDEQGLKTAHPVLKPKEKYRIILTGGSVARGGATDSTISAFLEKELNARLGTDRIEVLNAGVGAFVVEQEFIFIQLVLQDYQPDMIVGLDGYNDLVTYSLNRFQRSPHALPPHNWKHFKVIESNRAKRAFVYRFKALFSNIVRLTGYLDRRLRESRSPWRNVSESELEPVSRAFWKIVQDSHDFCRAKGIVYISFLQPIRFYDPSEAATNLTDEQKKLCRLYRLMEDGTLGSNVRFSLTGLLREPPRPYTDDCHMRSEGHARIARRMADVLVDRIVLPGRISAADSVSCSG